MHRETRELCMPENVMGSRRRGELLLIPVHHDPVGMWFYSLGEHQNWTRIMGWVSQHLRPEYYLKFEHQILFHAIKASHPWRCTAKTADHSLIRSVFTGTPLWETQHDSDTHSTRKTFNCQKHQLSRTNDKLVVQKLRFWVGPLLLWRTWRP